MKFTFVKSKYFFFAMIILFLIYSFIPNIMGLKGYFLGLFFLLQAFLNKRKGISIFPHAFSRERIKNWEYLMKFERTFYIIIGIAVLFSQYFVLYISREYNIFIALGFLLIAISFIAFIFIVKIDIE